MGASRNQLKLVWVTTAVPLVLERVRVALTRSLALTPYHAPYIDAMTSFQVCPSTRCIKCAKPLFMNASHVASNVFTDSLSSKYKDSNHQIWGRASNTSTNNGVVVFSPREMFHRQCFDIVSNAGTNASSTEV